MTGSKEYLLVSECISLFFLDLYSLQQKHCPTTLDEKSMDFFTVNLFENLHASNYGIYNYIYKVRKNATDGNPDL